MANDVSLVESVVRSLDRAGFEVGVFGGWAEELRGLRAPGPHRDVDLLIIDAPLDRLDEFMADHDQIAAKRMPHKRAFVIDGVAVELFLASRTADGVKLRWWGEARLPLSGFATERIKGMPVTSAAAPSRKGETGRYFPMASGTTSFAPTNPMSASSSSRRAECCAARSRSR